jgi:pimeloyl-ACP methyl ester carboxylesterase
VSAGKIATLASRYALNHPELLAALVCISDTELSPCH